MTDSTTQPTSKHATQALISFCLAAFLIVASGCALRTNSPSSNVSSPAFVPENLPLETGKDVNSAPVVLPAPLPSVVATEKPLNVSENTWGMEFKYTPIENAAIEQQAWGKAVAFISKSNGEMGTGFFVSSDGLLITNNHVIPRTECNAQRCSGIQIIRDFHTHGDFEIFSSFQVLFQDTDLDITLVKVELKPGEKVPFLHLMDETRNDAEEEILDNLEDRELIVLGHPNWASLQSSAAHAKSSGTNFIRLNSIAAPGSSGSPVIDMKTGSVVAVHHFGYWDKESVEKENGSVKHISEAVSVSPIIVILRQVFGSKVGENGNWDFSQFESIQNGNHYERVIPLSAEDAFQTFQNDKSSRSVDSIFFQFLGTRYEKDAFDLIFETLSGISIFEPKIDDFMDSLIRVSYARGKAIYLNQELFKKLILRRRDEPLSSDDFIEKSKLNAFRVLQGSLSQAQCISQIEKKFRETVKSDEFSLYEDLEDYCLSSRLTSGKSILEAVAQHWESYLKAIHDSSQSAEKKSDLLETAYKNLLHRIRNQMRMRSEDVDPAVLKSLIAATDQIKNHAKLHSTYAYADFLHTFLSRSPQQMLRGAFSR